LHWPDDKRLALIVTVNLEYWDLLKETAAPYYAGGPAILPDMLPGNIPDFPNFSWREYGQRVGVWRLFDIFDEAGVRASCTMNAKMALERRAVIDAALERGFELVPHNYEQGELLCHLQHKPDEERRVIEETLKIYERVTGRKPQGWLSSSLRGTTNTPAILVENGLQVLVRSHERRPALHDRDRTRSDRRSSLLNRDQRFHAASSARADQRGGSRLHEGAIRRLIRWKAPKPAC
jgi:allantoinase